MADTAHRRPTAVAAFHEVDFAVDGLAYPSSPIGQQGWRWPTQAVAAAGVEAGMGMKRHQVFLDAGFAAPQMQVDALMGDSPQFVEECTAYVVDSLRSVLPLFVNGGIATVDEVGIDPLATRFRKEVPQQRGIVRHNLLIGARTRREGIVGSRMSGGWVRRDGVHAIQSTNPRRLFTRTAIVVGDDQR